MAVTEPDKRCATCARWLTPTPESAYRADCEAGMLTRPEEWQCCPSWSRRVLPTVAQQSQSRPSPQQWNGMMWVPAGGKGP